MAVDTHLFHNWRPRVRVYTLTDPTHNRPNKFNYCDHIFATEGLLAKFAKIKTAQKFVVIRYEFFTCGSGRGDGQRRKYVW